MIKVMLNFVMKKREELEKWEKPANRNSKSNKLLSGTRSEPPAAAAAVCVINQSEPLGNTENEPTCEAERRGTAQDSPTFRKQKEPIILFASASL